VSRWSPATAAPPWPFAHWRRPRAIQRRLNGAFVFLGAFAPNAAPTIRTRRAIASRLLPSSGDQVLAFHLGLENATEIGLRTGIVWPLRRPPRPPPPAERRSARARLYQHRVAALDHRGGSSHAAGWERRPRRAARHSPATSSISVANAPGSGNASRVSSRRSDSRIAAPARSAAAATTTRSVTVARTLAQTGKWRPPPYSTIRSRTPGRLLRTRRPEIPVRPPAPAAGQFEIGFALRGIARRIASSAAGSPGARFRVPRRCRSREAAPRQAQRPCGAAPERKMRRSPARGASASGVSAAAPPAPERRDRSRPALV